VRGSIDPFNSGAYPFRHRPVPECLVVSTGLEMSLDPRGEALQLVMWVIRDPHAESGKVEVLGDPRAVPF